MNQQEYDAAQDRIRDLMMADAKIYRARMWKETMAEREMDGHAAAVKDRVDAAEKRRAEYAPRVMALRRDGFAAHVIAEIIGKSPNYVRRIIKENRDD